MSDPYIHMLTQRDDTKKRPEVKKEKPVLYTKADVEELIMNFYNKYGVIPTAKDFDKGLVGCAYNTAKAHLKMSPREYLQNKLQ